MAVKFDHEQGSLHLALGIDEERSDELDALVFFTIIDQTVLLQNLFDNPDEAPVNMRTKTGKLEKMFDECTTEEERIYIAMEFSKVDRDLDFESSGAQMFLSGLAMMYEDVDGNLEQFTKKFLHYKNKAKAEHERRMCDDCENDD